MQLILFIAGIFLAVSAPVAAAQPLRICCIGDSITWGSVEPLHAVSHGGYRADLLKILTHDGYHIRFVGSRVPPHNPGVDDACLPCEGYPGYTAGMIADAYAKSRVRAGIFLEEAGTNDGHKPLPDSYANQRRLWTEILAYNPGAIVFVATIPPCSTTYPHPGMNAYILRYNTGLRAAVAAFHNPRIVLADLYIDSSLTTFRINFGVRGLHPSNIGYHKMAEFWAQTIEQQFQPNS